MQCADALPEKIGNAKFGCMSGARCRSSYCCASALLWVFSFSLGAAPLGRARHRTADLRGVPTFPKAEAASDLSFLCDFQKVYAIFFRTSRPIGRITRSADLCTGQDTIRAMCASWFCVRCVIAPLRRPTFRSASSAPSRSPHTKTSPAAHPKAGGGVHRSADNTTRSAPPAGRLAGSPTLPR